MTQPHPAGSLPTVTRMIAELDRFVRGQVRARRDIATAVYNHYLLQAERENGGADPGRHHILLPGPTGSGKTYIVRTLAKFLDVPVGLVSANSLVKVGYKGQSVESIVRTLLDRAGGNPRHAEKGIIFLDDIDRIRRQDSGGSRDVSRHADSGLPPGIVDVRDWSTEKILDDIERIKVENLDWKCSTGSVREWWEAF